MALGSISFEQEPVDATDKVPVITNWNPVIGYMLFNDDISGLFYFKLVLEVYSELGTTDTMLVAKIRQRRNGYPADNAGGTQRARALFDLRDIINSLLVDTNYDQNNSSKKPIHSLGGNVAAKIFSKNGDNSQYYGNGTTTKTQILGVRVKGYQNYSSSVSESPSDDDTPSVTGDSFYMAASLPLETARSTDLTPTAYIQSDVFAKYKTSSSSNLFLSDANNINTGGQIEQSVLENDLHTVAFLNDNTKFVSSIQWIKIIYYDSSDAAIGNPQFIANSLANGGLDPNSTTTDVNRIIYFGCGPGNLQASTVDAYSSAGTVAGGARPSNFSGWAYYTIVGVDSNIVVTEKTKTYKFIKQDGSCKGYKVRRLAWRNSLGAWDYFNFTKKSSQTIKIERNTYSTLIGNFNEQLYTYSNLQRGKNTRQTTAMLEETINTDWLDESDTILIENLLKSTNAQIVANADTDNSVPVMVTDSAFIRKTVANDNIKIQYTIRLQYANPINTNS